MNFRTISVFSAFLLGMMLSSDASAQRRGRGSSAEGLALSHETNVELHRFCTGLKVDKLTPRYQVIQSKLKHGIACTHKHFVYQKLPTRKEDLKLRNDATRLSWPSNGGNQPGGQLLYYLDRSYDLSALNKLLAMSELDTGREINADVLLGSDRNELIVLRVLVESTSRSDLSSELDGVPNMGPFVKTVFLSAFDGYVKRAKKIAEQETALGGRLPAFGKLSAQAKATMQQELGMASGNAATVEVIRNAVKKQFVGKAPAVSKCEQPLLKFYASQRRGAPERTTGLAKVALHTAAACSLIRESDADFSSFLLGVEQEPLDANNHGVSNAGVLSSMHHAINMQALQAMKDVESDLQIGAERDLYSAEQLQISRALSPAQVGLMGFGLPDDRVPLPLKVVETKPVVVHGKQFTLVAATAKGKYRSSSLVNCRKTGVGYQIQGNSIRRYPRRTCDLRLGKMKPFRRTEVVLVPRALASKVKKGLFIRAMKSTAGSVMADAIKSESGQSFKWTRAMSRDGVTTNYAEYGVPVVLSKSKAELEKDQQRYYNLEEKSIRGLVPLAI